MQKVLTFTVNKKKYVSKPFNFEAMCLINDAHNNPKKNGPINFCRDALDYMFEGTEATQDVIDGLDVGVRTKLCVDLWNMYIDALSEKPEKNE